MSFFNIPTSKIIFSVLLIYGGIPFSILDYLVRLQRKYLAVNTVAGMSALLNLRQRIGSAGIQLLVPGAETKAHVALFKCTNKEISGTEEKCVS